MNSDPENDVEGSYTMLVSDVMTFLRTVKVWTSKVCRTSEERLQLLAKGKLLGSQLEASEEHLHVSVQIYSDVYGTKLEKAHKLIESLENVLSILTASERSRAESVDEVSRGLRRATRRQSALQSVVTRVEEERRLAFQTIRQPHWQVKHDFHMIALEHFRGNRQEQLLQIAELFPGHLMVAAMAKQTSLLPHFVFPELKAAEKLRAHESMRLEGLTGSTEDHGKNRETLNERIKDLQLFVGNCQSPVTEFKSQNPGISRGVSGYVGGMDYLAIKMKYFTALNLGSKSTGTRTLPNLPEPILHTSPLLFSDVKEHTLDAEVSEEDYVSVTDWIKRASELKDALVSSKKTLRKSKENRELVLKTRAMFEREMAGLRLLRL